MCARCKHFHGTKYGETDLPLSLADSSPSPMSPPCSLWLFSAFSVLNSEKRNTEATKIHREPEPQPKKRHVFFSSWPKVKIDFVAVLRLDSGARLRRDFQQLAHVAAQNRHAIGIAQPGCRENLVHRRHRPRKRVVGAHADLADSAYGDQMPQRLRRKNDRIKIQLLQIFSRFFLKGLFALLGEDRAPMVHAVGIRRQVAAPMGRADFQVRKTVQRSLENHVGKENSGFERVPNHIAQAATSLHPGADTRGNRAILRMHKYQGL